MKSPKKFIYFPSLSSGNSRDFYTKDKSLPSNPDLPIRFYSEFYKEYEHGRYYYPYFLLSAGHNISHENLRQDMGLGENTVVIGDSGGYQIATGAKKYTKDFMVQVFKWLETNSDIAMNLDIPPWTKFFTYEEAMRISIENFKYFEQKQSGKTKFLNVLQGPDEAGYNKWYNAVKDFNFSGWGIGSIVGDQYKLMYTTALLLERGEFHKDNIKWIHYLGLGAPIDFYILEILQKQINKITDNKVTLSSDTSSPNRATIFGTYYFDCNYRELSYTSMSFTRDRLPTYNQNAKLPCSIDCPACKGLIFNDFAKAGNINDQSEIITNHNVWVYKHINDNIANIVNLSDDSIKDIFGADNFNLYKAIVEITESKHPMNTLDKYKSLFTRFSNKDKNKADTTLYNEFFS